MFLYPNAQGKPAPVKLTEYDVANIYAITHFGEDLIGHLEMKRLLDLEVVRVTDEAFWRSCKRIVACEEGMPEQFDETLEDPEEKLRSVFGSTREGCEQILGRLYSRYQPRV